MLSPPLSDFEIFGSQTPGIAVHDRGRPHYISRHNAHISDRFAKATDTVEKNSSFALRPANF
jgi:hypothetical protein